MGWAVHAYTWIPGDEDVGHGTHDPHPRLQHTATHCNRLLCTATHCNALQYTAIGRIILIQACNTLQHTAKHCNTLQHTAMGCMIIIQVLFFPPHLTPLYHSYMWRDSFTCSTWRIHACVMTRLYMRHNSYKCDMAWIYPYICVNKNICVYIIYVYIYT